jgi:hypothetical protein
MFWWKWMASVSWAIIAAGAAMVFLPEAAAGSISQLLYFVPDRFSEFDEQAARYIRFAHSVVGAVMAGWGVSFLGLLYGPFRNGSRNGWITLAASVTVWFGLDTTVSILLGFWQNAVLNFIIADLYAIPLAATYRWFFRK